MAGDGQSQFVAGALNGALARAENSVIKCCIENDIKLSISVCVIQVLLANQ